MGKCIEWIFGPLTILSQLAAHGDNNIAVGSLPILNMDSVLRLLKNADEMKEVT